MTAVILDLDGTLIDSSPGVVEAVNYSLCQMGEPPQPPDAIKAFIGFPLSQMYSNFTAAPVAELYRHFRVKAEKAVVASTTALPGAEETLRRLKEDGYRLAIATTKVRCNVDGILGKLGWRDYFDTTVTGDEVPRVKPDPAAFRLALRQMSMKAFEALAVGDTINDVLAAQAVPMRVIALASPYGGREKVLAAAPDSFIESIAELPGLLTRLYHRKERKQ